MILGVFTPSYPSYSISTGSECGMIFASKQNEKLARGRSFEENKKKHRSSQSSGRQSKQEATNASSLASPTTHEHKTKDERYSRG
jgi:hypothetical protein